MKRKSCLLSIILSLMVIGGYAASISGKKANESQIVSASGFPTIEEVIATRPNFPTSKENAWLNENHDRIYVENSNLIIEDFSGTPKISYDLSSILGAGIGDYIYNDMLDQTKIGIIHFRVIDSALQDIRYESLVSQTASVAGTYMPRNYVVFSNDDDNITNLNPNRSVDQMILPNEEYNLYIIKPEKQGQSNFYVEIRSYVGEDFKTYGYISLNPKEDRKIDHLAYSLDGTNYTDILSYPDYCEEQDKDALYIQDITGLFYIKSVGASNHTLLTKHDKLDATCEQDGHLAYYECECDNLYFEDQTLLKKIGDEIALDAWLNGAGKIAPLGHHGVKQYGKVATTTEDGWKDYYKCSGCDKCFEDEECLKEITDLEAWKIGAGKLEKLPEPAPEKLSAGAIVGISVGSVVGASLIAYIVMFVVFLKKNKAPKFLIKSFEILAKLFRK